MKRGGQERMLKATALAAAAVGVEMQEEKEEMSCIAVRLYSRKRKR